MKNARQLVAQCMEAAGGHGMPLPSISASSSMVNTLLDTGALDEDSFLANLATGLQLPWIQLPAPDSVDAPELKRLMPARVAFLISSAAVAKLVLMATVWVMAGFDSAQFASAFSAPQAWIGTGASIVQGISACAGTLYRSIPPLWLYGGLAFVGAMYAALFGLGATAYRTLYANR